MREVFHILRRIVTALVRGIQAWAGVVDRASGVGKLFALGMPLALLCVVCGGVAVAIQATSTALGLSPTRTPALRPTAQVLQVADVATSAAVEVEVEEADTPTLTPSPTVELPSPTVAPSPTVEPTTEPTLAPTATPEPTATPIPPSPVPPTPIPAPAIRDGVAPSSRTDCPADYPIKGNVGSNGRIYHVPGSRSYNRTNPEICFATAADAEAAGFRAPLR